MRKVVRVAALVLALGAAGDLAAQESQSEPPRRREGIAFVGIWDPTPMRIGLLVPLSDRWVIRPDLSGDAYDVEGAVESWTLNLGVSLMRRSAPTDAGFVYGSARLGFAFDDYATAANTRLTGYELALSVGGHSHINSMLALFGESGFAMVYAEENDATTTIDRSIRVRTRFGFAIRRPRQRD